MRKQLVIGSFSVLILICSLSACDSLAFPTGVNGVAILESGGGNVFPPPPVTHAPLAGAIITIEPVNGGQAIATQIADSKGGFRIEVPAGSYLLVAQPPQDQGFILTPPQQTVVVVPHELTQVVVQFNAISHF